MRSKFDTLDRKLARHLTEEGREGVNDLAEVLGVSAPTARSRLKSLIERGYMKIGSLLNIAERPELTTALVAINANANGKLDDLARRIADLPFVTWSGITTGRYDMMVELVFEGDMEDLYRFTSVDLPELAGHGVIRGSETFIIMRSHRKWVSLPKGVWEDNPQDP